MADTGRLDELQRKFDENPRRFFAPLANEYRKAGNIERAIELCEEYLRQLPGHMSGYIVYGQALFDGGRHTEASEAFQQALAVDPENIIALKHLGDIAKYSGDRDAAAVWYHRVIELDPKNDDIVAYLADKSPHEASQPSQASSVPLLQQGVYPEPAPDSEAVALSDLMEQPDVPLAAAPTFSMSEIGVEQFGETGDQVVGAEEARAAFEEMLADRLPAAAGDLSRVEDGETEGMPEPLELLPLITEFTISVIDPQAVQEQPVADLFSDEPLVEQPVVAASAEIEVPFVTETMADLYLRQGFTAQALEVYRRLAATGDYPNVLDKIQGLELSIVQQKGASASVPVSSAEPQVTVRDFFARIGARRPNGVAEAPQAATGGLDTLFDPTRVDAADARAASALAGAYSAAP